MTTRLFIDWLSLTDPANPISGSRHLSLAFTRSINAWDIRDKFKDFAIEYSGIDAGETTSFAALRAQSDAFLFDRRRDIVLDPSPEIIAQFLNEPRSSATGLGPLRRIGVALSSSGYVAVAIEHESDTKQDTLLRDRAESIAALLVRLVGIAATGVAPQRGLEITETEDRRTFLVSPHSIMPVAAVWHLPDNWSGDMKTAAEAALREKTLPGLAVRQEHSNNGFIEAGLVLNAIAQRFALASEQCIRQIERVTLSSEEAPRSIDRRPDPVADKDEALRRISDKQVTDGNAILRRISRIVWFSTLVLCSVFLILIFLPSTVLAPASPKHDTVPFLFTAFFVFSLFISWAIMDLERLFDHRPQALRTKVSQHSQSPIWNWLRSLLRKWPRALVARLIFAHPSVLGILVGIFLAFSVLIFWEKGQLLGMSWDIGALKAIRAYVSDFNLLREKRDGTFATILKDLVWAFPALAIGVLKFSYDKLAGIVIGTQEDDRYQAFLEKLDPVLAAGTLYARQLENMLRKPSSGTLDQAILNPVLAAKVRYAGRLESQRDPSAGIRLPDFDNVRERIALLKSHLAKAIEQAKTNFNRSAAFTAAMVAALAAIPGLNSIKPDSRDDFVAEAFQKGLNGEACELRSGTNEVGTQDDAGAEPEKAPAKTDKCNENERLAWTIGGAVREVKAGMPTIALPDSSELDDRLKGIIVNALKEEDLLKGSITAGIEGATWPPPPDIQLTIHQAVLNALQDADLANKDLQGAIAAGVVDALTGREVGTAVETGGQNALDTVLDDERLPDRISKAITDALGDDWLGSLKDVIDDALEQARKQGVAALTEENHAAIFNVLQDPRIVGVIKQALEQNRADGSATGGSTAGGPAADDPAADAEAIAKAILEEFRKGSFPVLPDLPQDCRQDDRLIATVYFEQSGSTWGGVSCITAPEIGSDASNVLWSTRPDESDEGGDLASVCGGDASPTHGTLESARDAIWESVVLAHGERLEVGTDPDAMQVLVVGYADSTGPVSSNIEISSARARRVAEFLRDRIKRNLADITVSHTGRSEASLASEFRSGTAYQSADSRRAEVRLCYASGKSGESKAALQPAVDSTE